MSKLFPLLFLSLFFAMPVAVLAGDDLEPYPPAGEGMVRHVLRLPPLEPPPRGRGGDSVAQVQLLVGRTVLVESPISYFFRGGEIQVRRNLQDRYYVVRKLGAMVPDTRSPRMEPGPKERFIQGGTPYYYIRYDSRSPIVVYAPEGVEVKYRILRAEPEMNAMEPG